MTTKYQKQETKQIRRMIRNIDTRSPLSHFKITRKYLRLIKQNKHKEYLVWFQKLLCSWRA